MSNSGSIFDDSEPLNVFVYTLWSISLVCAIYMTIAFNRKIMKIFSISIALMSLNVLLSTIWGNDLSKAPRQFCIAQGLMLQFTAYMTSMAALYFTWESYRLIVLKIKKSSTFIKSVYSLMIAYPIIMTSILALISSEFNSINVHTLCCDITNPSWVRLFGYAGVNVLIAIPGAYWSGRVAWIVFNHSDKTLRTFSTLAVSQERDPSTVLINIKNAVNPTVISLIASINTWIDIFLNVPLQIGVSGNDVAGSIIGIVVFIIFGTAGENIQKRSK
ncbi:16476_t:CDS:2 [Cetraspora pellucida]|uniref:16476_t:CDS:1 n=1 Tax=Cetraspora pellucida TaxID=1433469 RepID=A0A9N9DIU7_9GLOM|nr:16476_t:CDS:2 [Cetraspora pellucida]